MKLALEDVKVIEYGNFISAPYCGKMLADLGAEVIKVEEPGQGDVARRSSPFLDDIPDSERSGLFLDLNTNKQGVTLNPEEAAGREIFKKLIKDADILIEDTKPGKMAELELDYDSLQSINPSLIVTSITPFGQTGPYKDYKGSDLIFWHMSGAGRVTPRNLGPSDFLGAEQGMALEPLRVLHLASFMAGVTAAVATMCALRVQRRTGLGQHVDVSQLEAAIIMSAHFNQYYIYEHRSATRVSRAAVAPLGFLKCKDGWVCTHCGGPERHWQRFVEMMGNPDWADEELFKERASRAEYWDSLGPLMSIWLMEHTKAEIFELGGKRFPIGPVNSMPEMMENKQLKERGFFVEIEHPKTDRLTYPGAPYKFSKTPWAIRKPAPLLGQHNNDVYCERLGYTKKELAEMREAGII